MVSNTNAHTKYVASIQRAWHRQEYKQDTEQEVIEHEDNKQEDNEQENIEQVDKEKEDHEHEDK